MDLNGSTNPTTQKLMAAFMQFGKAAWHERIIAGCKPSEIRVLFCIKKGMRPGSSDSSEMKASEISKLLHVTSPTITQLLKGLEANGLVERRVDPTDRRAVGLTLTEKGEKITQQAAHDFSSSFDGLIEYLGEEESSQLAELLLKVFHYYSEKTTSMKQGDSKDAPSSPVYAAPIWNGDKDV